MKIQTSVRVCIAGIVTVSALLLFAMSSGTAPGSPTVTILSPTAQSPVQQNLVSDIPGLAHTTDPNLINPWGISNSPTSPYWVADQGTNKTTLYNGLGAATAAVVNVPAVGFPSGPTGTVFNSTTGFLVSGTPANFIFVTLDGTVAAGTGTAARVTEATLPGAVFTGLALANNGTANFLYAADFVSGQMIKVFDSTFALTTLTAAFVDPTLPVGYAPYNIQLLSGKLYVTYAQIGVRGANIGAGLGYVSVFDTNGNFLQRLISNGPLNAPWGLAIAPTGFMNFAGDLLVGNFGDGVINAFDPATGASLGTISSPAGHPIANPGLWAIQFGNTNAGSTATTLFFNAGINGEQDGLFGSLTPGPVTLTFGNQLVNTPSAAQTVTVENTGSAPLTLTAAPALTGTNATDFAIAAGSTCTNAATIAAGSSCTVNVTFTPGAVGSRGPATLSIADNATGSPHVVIITGPGVAAAPAVTLAPPTSLTFPGQLVSTTSTPAQTVTVTNSGTAPLTFGASAISVSNDFAQTNTCNSATVAVNATCTISVTFTPASTSNNPRTGTLTIANNAAGSPQTVALSGTAWDFSLSAPASVSTSAGTPASIVVTVNALGGFTGPVTLTCSGTIPQGSCSAPAGAVTAPGTGTLTVTTSASLLPPASRQIPPMSTRQIVLVSFALLMLFALLAAGRTRTRVGFAGAMLICAILAGCASNSTTNNRTPAGAYPLTVTGTSGGVTRTATVTVTVN